MKVATMTNNTANVIRSINQVSHSPRGLPSKTAPVALVAAMRIGVNKGNNTIGSNISLAGERMLRLAMSVPTAAMARSVTITINR